MHHFPVMPAFVTASPLRYHTHRATPTSKRPRCWHARLKTPSPLVTPDPPSETLSPELSEPPEPPEPPEPTPKPNLLPLLSVPLLCIPFLPLPQFQPLQHLFATHLATYLTGPHFPVTAGIFLSAFIQSLTGFGFAIVSVASLTNLPWIANSSLLQDVQPVAATLGALTTFALLLPEIGLVKWKGLAPLIFSSTLLTPLGIYLAGGETDVLLRLLGGLITGYVLYSVSGVKLPKVVGSDVGAWFLGGVAGVFGGMFDITGPALVVYGDAKGWVDDFRRNLLAVLGFNSIIVLSSDYITGRLQDFYYFDFVKAAAPAAVLGIVLGKMLGRSLKPEGFKRVVMGTCFVVGVKMLLF